MKTNNNKSSNVTRKYAHQGLPELSDGLEGTKSVQHRRNPFRNRRECHTNTAGPVSPLLFSGRCGWLGKVPLFPLADFHFNFVNRAVVISAWKLRWSSSCIHRTTARLPSNYLVTSMIHVLHNRETSDALLSACSQKPRETFMPITAPCSCVRWPRRCR